MPTWITVNQRETTWYYPICISRDFCWQLSNLAEPKSTYPPWRSGNMPEASVGGSGFESRTICKLFHSLTENCKLGVDHFKSKTIDIPNDY